MKTLRSISIITAGIILFFSCERLPDEQVPDKMNLTKKSLELIESDNEFGLDFFQKVITNDTSDNIMVSPLSVALALGMTYNGAADSTKEAMKETLKLSGLTDEEINVAYKSIVDQLLKLDPKVMLSIANSIWYRQDFTVLPEFIETNRQYYDAEVNEIDFNLPGAKDIINGWVDEKTKGLIPEIIDYIPDLAVMYLINAIYFKGLWKYEFDPEATGKQPFYLNNGSTALVDMMEMESDVLYLSNSLFSAVNLPYGDGAFSMTILLPQSPYTPCDIVEELTNENWNTWMNSFGKQHVVVRLPRFKFEFFRLLNQDLTEMGMGIAFDQNRADFAGINPDKQLFISRVLHKTFIEVNEEGTEAAAVTAVEISLTSADPDLPTAIFFVVDKPFLFAIRENSSGTILFMGKVNRPEYQE
jgi:serine protease inhibitor